jgi:histidyl-tRNA synthetase
MSKIKPSLPKGTRDFGPVELRKRQYIFNTIKNVFEKYGFQPIETPVMENLSTLEGKYGEEGDKLLFRILNSGDNLTEIQNSKNKIQNNKDLIHVLSEKGLRYDLTIPFARYVVMHQNEIAFPFKRYQIQPVWRADRPQRGRYREFYQCDADVIGSDSLLNEVELILIYDEVFKKLNISATIEFNNRKLLAGFVDEMGVDEKLTEFTVVLDKLDKIGKEKAMEEFEKIHLPMDAVKVILNNTIGKINQEQLKFLKEFLRTSEIGRKGIEEVEFILKHTTFSKLKSTLARGLDYYTGTIFEVKANGVQMGSIGGGGRYDNLTGVFGLEGVSGVGISFGIERIYDVMEELGLFKHLDLESSTTKVLFVNFGGANELQAFEYANKLRQQNIAAEMYPASVKLDKQMKYANAKKIPFVAFTCEAELKNNTLQLKNMQTGEQAEYKIDEAIEILKK